MQNMDYILTTDNLCKQYKHVKAVDSINLHIKKGDIYVQKNRLCRVDATVPARPPLLRCFPGLQNPRSAVSAYLDAAKANWHPEDFLQK